MNEIISLRHHLHRNPEISNREFNTSAFIENYFSSLNPSKTVNLGKTGLAFIFDSGTEGEVTVIRAELDALPIEEKSGMPHSSEVYGISHACGHDGHMAILAGLGKMISEYPPQKGKIVLLFQPAEEVEQGARDVVENPLFKEIKPTRVFALHNIPGVPKNHILLRKGSFAAASMGVTAKLYGKTSHAAEPENGISPVNAIAEIIKQLQHLKDSKELFKDLILLTVIHVLVGEISFGTSPGYAEIRITLRAYENEDIELLYKETEKIIKTIATSEKLSSEVSISELFPATVNSDDCVSITEEAAKKLGLQYSFNDEPYKWSEDFGYYSEVYNCGFFGLGAGENQPALHNPEYDFPDDIIESGIQIFYNICKIINYNK